MIDLACKEAEFLYFINIQESMQMNNPILQNRKLLQLHEAPTFRKPWKLGTLGTLDRAFG